MVLALIVPTTVRDSTKSQTGRSRRGGEASQVRSGIRKCVLCMGEAQCGLALPHWPASKTAVGAGSVGFGFRAA